MHAVFPACGRQAFTQPVPPPALRLPAVHQAALISEKFCIEYKNAYLWR
jgi:hypothetical protein